MDYRHSADEQYVNHNQQQQQQNQPPAIKKSGKVHNVLPLWGNESTMNLNPLILANIQGSSYFKVHLFRLKTYHEVVDEIYYQVKHLEPWERGSRKTSGQTGMCGGVRGVGAGGIVSTAFCLLYKLYTLRLTRKQLNGLLTHTDSPYIRALGFMYIRYTQPPAHLYDWYEEYLQDEEEVDVKAGGGQTMLIGQMLYQWLVKLDWFSTLFPRIPVPIQKQIEQKLSEYSRDYNINFQTRYVPMERENNNSGAGGSGRQGRTVNDSREYFDRQRDRDNRGEKDRYSKYERERDDRRIKSRSPERNDREYRDRDRNSRDNRHGERERYNKERSSDDYYRSERKDKREKDNYRDIDRRSNDKYSSSNTSSSHKHREYDRDRRY